MFGFFGRRIGGVGRGLRSRLSDDHFAGLMGVGWTTLAHFIGMAVRLGSSLILTRLLVPEAYGVFGAALAVLIVVELLSDIGLRPAVMLHPNGMTPAVLGTAWLIGLGRGTFLGLIVVGISQVPGLWSENPGAAVILPVLALRPLLYGLQSPGVPVLHRELRYRDVSILEVGQTLAGTGATILFAWWNPSVWAFVFGMLTGDLALVLLTYSVCPRTSRPRWDGAVARELFHFGNRVFLNTLMMALWLYADRLFGWHFISVEAFGVYVLALNLAEAGERLILRAGDVYFSVLSRQTDPERQLADFRAVARKLVLWGMPLMAAAAVAAPAAVRLLYPPAFEGAGLLLAVLVARVMIRTLCNVQYAYLLVRKQVYVATRSYFVAAVVQFLSMGPLAAAFGVAGLAYSVLLSAAALALMQTAQMTRLGPGRFGPLLGTLMWVAVGIGVVLAVR